MSRYTDPRIDLIANELASKPEELTTALSGWIRRMRAAVDHPGKSAAAHRDGGWELSIRDRLLVDSGGNLTSSTSDEFPNGVLDSGVVNSGPLDPWHLAKAYEVTRVSGFRSGRGLYYTEPRIVQYMCRRAVVEILDSRLHESRSEILEWLGKKETPGTPASDFTARVEGVLMNLKILDPACGCGDFLVGILAELHTILCRSRRPGGARAEQARSVSFFKTILGNITGLDVDRHAIEITQLRIELAAVALSGEPLRLKAADLRVADSLITPGLDENFDLVIGNPPYVRHEEIRDPGPASASAASAKSLAASAKSLAASAKSLAASAASGVSPAQYKARIRARTESWSGGAGLVPGRSDLYLYFMARGLASLTPGGILVFITSNAWLDVGYARRFRQWLLENMRILEVMEEAGTRAFDAQVNTIIVTLSRKALASGDRDNDVRFVSWTGSLDRDAVNRIDRDRKEPEAKNLQLHEGEPFSGTCRVVNQTTVRDRAVNCGNGPVTIDRLGGLYLRAPEVVTRTLQFAGDRLVRLGDLARVRFGVKTGANDFFFIPSDDPLFRSDPKYWIPAARNSADLRSVLVDPATLGHRLLACRDQPDDIPSTRIREWIQEAEAQGLHRRSTCRSRTPWYGLRALDPARIHCNYQIDKIMHFFVSRTPFVASNNFLAIEASERPFALAASLNSSWTQLYVASTGRTNFGGGLLKIETFEVADLPIVDPTRLNEERCREIIEGGGRLELGSDVRRQLDDEVLPHLSLPQAEGDRIRECLEELWLGRRARSRSRARSPARPVRDEHAAVNLKETDLGRSV